MMGLGEGKLFFMHFTLSLGVKVQLGCTRYYFQMQFPTWKPPARHPPDLSGILFARELPMGVIIMYTLSRQG